uniref:Putative secreted peptide n=1 Tax=Anopheles braziliensis TaxID=58242 RepID=A0A2M3ZTG9_9DIPT
MGDRFLALDHLLLELCLALLRRLELCGFLLQRKLQFLPLFMIVRFHQRYLGVPRLQPIQLSQLLFAA